MRSKKESSLDSLLMEKVQGFGLSGKAEKAMNLMLHDDELQKTQEYANTVSIVRLGYNDHGPVHMRIVVLNAMIMMDLLRKANIKTSLEKDECGNFEDSLTAVICASMMHDLGMCAGRQDHDLLGVNIAMPILCRIIKEVYKTDLHKQIMVQSTALEGIYGHMGTRTIHSLEAGIVQVADGCDMTKGRARIPIALGMASKTGYIHQYSANTIEKVEIIAGKEKPIRIEVLMSNEAGIFQVEEVLLKKIAASTAKPHIELFAKVMDKEARQYL